MMNFWQVHMPQKVAGFVHSQSVLELVQERESGVVPWVIMLGDLFQNVNSAFALVCWVLIGPKLPNPFCFLIYALYHILMHWLCKHVLVRTFWTPFRIVLCSSFDLWSFMIWSFPYTCFIYEGQLIHDICVDIPLWIFLMSCPLHLISYSLRSMNMLFDLCNK